jgi:hypothetical protein
VDGGFSVCCKFLLDPIVSVRLTTPSSIRVDEEFSAKMQKELRKWPFMWEGRKFHETPTGPGGKFTQIQQRDFIKSKLVLGETIHESDCNF